MLLDSNPYCNNNVLQKIYSDFVDAINIVAQSNISESGKLDLIKYAYKCIKDLNANNDVEKEKVMKYYMEIARLTCKRQLVEQITTNISIPSSTNGPNNTSMPPSTNKPKKTNTEQVRFIPQHRIVPPRIIKPKISTARRET